VAGLRPVERVRARGGSDAGDGGRVSVRAPIPGESALPAPAPAPPLQPRRPEGRVSLQVCGDPLRPRRPGGVDSVMSPQVALCEAGSRESSAGGFCRAGLATRGARGGVLRWARITQAGLSACRPRPAPGSVRAAPGIGREPARGRRRPGPGPAPSRPAPAGSARSSLDPRERLPEVRARGSSDDLGGYPTISRPGDTPGAAGFDFPTPAREINASERTGAGARIRRQGRRCGPPDPVPVFHDAGEKARCR